MSLLVPTIQQTIGFTILGNDGARPVNTWIQIFDGVARQSQTQARYQLTAADMDNYWGSVYTDALMNSKILLDKAVAEGSPHNAGVAKVLLAYTIGITTDLFGDVPYLEALRGTENVLTPGYDSQEIIYGSIFTLLDEAIADLGNAEEPVGIDGDVIYDGDADAWLKAAYAIKARAQLQLSNVNGANAYKGALAQISNALASNSDNMLVPFDAANPNPLNQFMVERADIRMCQTFLDELEANSDPRIPFLYGADDEGGVSGSSPNGENEAASPPGEYLASQSSPIVMISYAEVKFIEAEAAFMDNDPERAVQAYKDAVEASLEEIAGEVDADWFATIIDSESAGTISLEKIMMQKRIALAGQIQPFSDWRRTGIPSLALVPGATKTEIPRRFPYAQGEIIYNAANVPAVGSIIVPVWWDN
jgi:hypothetical protein